MRNPAASSDVVDTYYAGNENDAESAIEAAVAAQDGGENCQRPNEVFSYVTPPPSSDPTSTNSWNDSSTKRGSQSRARQEKSSGRWTSSTTMPRRHSTLVAILKVRAHGTEPIHNTRTDVRCGSDYIMKLFGRDFGVEDRPCTCNWKHCYY